MRIFKNLFRKYGRDEAGVISMEFAILAPVILAWAFISLSFFDGFKTYMGANKATYTAVDLISRQDVVTDEYINTVGSIFESIVDSDGSDPTIVVTSILQVDANTKRIQWSTAVNGGDRIYDQSELPTAIIPNMAVGESLVLIQTGVPFEPFISIANLVSTTFTNEIAITPRFHTEITNTDQPIGPERATNENEDSIDPDASGSERS